MYSSSDLQDYWLVNDFVTREDPSGAGVVGRFSFDWRAAAQQLGRWRAQSAAPGAATLSAEGDAALVEELGGLRVDEGGSSPDDALKMARASADEAAAARKRIVPSAAPAAGSKDREPSVSGAVQHCQSHGMTCAGCGGVFGLGARIEPLCFVLFFTLLATYMHNPESTLAINQPGCSSLPNWLFFTS